MNGRERIRRRRMPGIGRDVRRFRPDSRDERVSQEEKIHEPRRSSTRFSAVVRRRRRCGRRGGAPARHCFRHQSAGQAPRQNYNTIANPAYETYIDNVRLDAGVLTRYDRSMYGPSASAYLERDHAYSWRIRYRVQGIRSAVGIDMLDAAGRWGYSQWDRSVVNYGCYFVNRSGNSWRAVSIIRRHC